MESGIKLTNRPRLADGILLVLLVTLTAFSPRFLPAGAVGELLTVQTPDIVREIPLNIDDHHPLTGPLGTANLVVEKGSARLENAPCPMKICEAMGSINRAGQAIVCLPNRIIVKVAGEEEIDAVSR